MAGVDHVGIGSDFDGGIIPPKGLHDCTTYAVLADHLRRRGIKEAEVGKIMGGNVARLLGDVLPEY